MKKAPPQTPPGKHYDPREGKRKRDAVLRMIRVWETQKERGALNAVDGGAASEKRKERERIRSCVKKWKIGLTNASRESIIHCVAWV